MTRLTEYGIYVIGLLLDAVAVVSLAAVSLALIAGAIFGFFWVLVYHQTWLGGVAFFICCVALGLGIRLAWR